MRVHLFPPYRQQLTTDGALSEHTRGNFMMFLIANWYEIFFAIKVFRHFLKAFKSGYFVAAEATNLLLRLLVSFILLTV